MKTKKQTFVCLRQLASFFLFLLFTFALTVTTAISQDDPQSTSELQPASKVSGSGGGGLAVSKYNGSVSYTYPISTQSIGGHSLNVSLNYCGSVSHRSFKYYENTGGLDEWYTKDKVSPE